MSKHSFLLFVDYSGVNLVSIRWPSPQCCLHKPVHPIKLTLCILIRRFGLGLWIPWRHFEINSRSFRISKNRILKAALCLARYLVRASDPHPANTCGTLSGDLRHIRHTTIEVPPPFPDFLWWYNWGGNICWHNSCMATTVWVGNDLQLFIHAKHRPLSRAESSNILLVSFPCHFFFPSGS